MPTAHYDYQKIEQKWQDHWFKNKIYETTTQHNRKFFIHFAYPGVSGYLHVGHMRGFTYCDIIARYKRMTGYDILFPAGFHASGIPSVGFAKKVERNDPQTIKILKDNGLTEKEIQKLTDPQEVVNYFSKVYVDDYWKRFGFLIDYSRLMNTISEGYQHFITWQFHKLKEHNLLIQKPHHAPFCPNCGPVAVDKSETDIQKGGASEILEFTVIKFTLPDGTILPAATLRPETIFGVTNMWINPEVTYEKVQVNNETWICSKECIEKISYQYNNVTLLNQQIPGKKLLGKTCTIPLVNREIPILSGPFADPRIATGIVMSVPAHAPYDWIALKESPQPIEAITIIDVKDLGPNPAKKICDQLNITSQKQTEKLDEATELVYKKEFHTGLLNHHCGTYAGRSITDIKDEVKNELITHHLAQTMHEFSQEVICRCGEHVIIKQIPDQWFIKYSDYTLTKNTIDHTKTMNLYPENYREEIPKVLDWFDDRAAIRKGSWLGTEFPFKKDWIIEPISDSTLYPAYYIISKYINDQQLTPKDMTNEFFDYVFLGHGKPYNTLWKTIREDFTYWYPVDINLGGKEHKTVHFPVFLMNHVAIMPQQYWPQGIFVHWWVTQKGKEKISKSKGGAEPILKAASHYSVDGLRLYYAHVGSPFVDVEWDTNTVLKYKNRILTTWKLIQQLLTTKKENTNDNLDTWLTSILQQHITNIRNAFDTYDLRVASNEIFFEMQKTIRWYLKRGGANKQQLQHFLKHWILLMTPVTPHLAEELWHQQKNTTLVSNHPYPTPEKQHISPTHELGENLLSNVVNDINEILKVTNITPKKIYIYTAPKWKQHLFQQALQLDAENNLTMSILMKETMKDPKNKTRAKQISQYTNKIITEIKKLNDTDKQRYRIPLDSTQYLTDATVYLQDIFNCDITIYNADDPNINDPADKARHAVPLRPALYIK